MPDGPTLSGLNHVTNRSGLCAFAQWVSAPPGPGRNEFGVYYEVGAFNMIPHYHTLLHHVNLSQGAAGIVNSLEAKPSMSSGTTQ